MPAGVKLSVHPPRMIPEPMVTADRPWEAFVNAYATLGEMCDTLREAFGEYEQVTTV